MVLDISDIPTILVIAGIIFIFIAIVGELSGQIKTKINPKQAVILGIVGIILLGLGLFASSTGVFLPPELKPKSTPTPTPTATPLISAKITYPVGEVYSPTKVEGTVSRALKEGEYMWIALGLPSSGYWWPEGPIIPYGNLEWRGIVYIGVDIGTEVEIAVLIVDANLNSKFEDYISEQTSGLWPPIEVDERIIEEKIIASVTPTFKGKK